MSAAGSGDAVEELWQPKVNPWIIAGAVSLAAFMEVLDTSIANVAPPHIAGGLAASNDESTWVLTSYLVSNAIVLPLSGWLVASLGRKRFFLICITFFTVSSFLCGIAPSLGFLLLFRVMQGAFGGGLQPMAQSILGDSFAPEKRGLAFSLYGITTICAPAVGPTLGGWITDNYSWRWLFYINVPVGILAFLLVYQLVEDPPYIARLKAKLSGFDFIGFSLLTLGVGALQIVLDKGQEDDWFGSHFITTLVVIAVVCLVSLVIWEWYQKAPIIDVRMFKSFNFASATLMMFTLGILLFSSLVLMPQFLQTLLGYTSELAGLALSAGGMVLLIEMPIMGQLTTKIQARRLIAFGWLALSIAMFYSTQRIDLQLSFSAAVWLRIAQVIGLGFLFVPITLAAYVGIAPEKNNSVAGIINFMRNMGSSVGTSLVTTLIARRSQFHQLRLVEKARVDNPNFANSVQGLTHHFVSNGVGKHEAHIAAYARIYQSLQAQAASLAYIDTFMVLSVGAGIMFLLAFVLKKNDPGGGGHHIAE